jgi:hypothetical protein
MTNAATSAFAASKATSGTRMRKDISHAGAAG